MARPAMFDSKLLAFTTGSASPQFETQALFSKTRRQSVSTLHGVELYFWSSAVRLFVYCDITVLQACETPITQTAQHWPSGTSGCVPAGQIGCAHLTDEQLIGRQI